MVVLPLLLAHLLCVAGHLGRQPRLRPNASSSDAVIVPPRPEVHAEYPHPLEHPAACGSDGFTLLCDPDAVLHEMQRANVTDVLHLIAEGKQGEYTNKWHCLSGAWSGWQLGVAIVKSLRGRDAHGESRADTARRFAQDVHASWGLAAQDCPTALLFFCEEDWLIAVVATDLPSTVLREVNVVAFVLDDMPWEPDTHPLGQAHGLPSIGRWLRDRLLAAAAHALLRLLILVARRRGYGWVFGWFVVLAVQTAGTVLHYAYQEAELEQEDKREL